jgi:hypothetical protein
MHLYHFLNPCLCLPPLHVESSLQSRSLFLSDILIFEKLESFSLADLFILKQAHNLLLLPPSDQLEHKAIIWIGLYWLRYTRKWLLVSRLLLIMFDCVLRSIYTIFILIIIQWQWGLRCTQTLPSLWRFKYCYLRDNIRELLLFSIVIYIDSGWWYLDLFKRWRWPSLTWIISYLQRVLTAGCQRSGRVSTCPSIHAFILSKRASSLVGNRWICITLILNRLINIDLIVPRW